MNTSTKNREWAVRSASDLGRAIAGVRSERGLSQEELARELAVDRTYLTRLEGGASSLALERSLRALRRMGAAVTITLSSENDGTQD